MSERECDYTYNPVCPQCGYEWVDAWEIDFGGVADGTAELECDCGAVVICQRHVSVDYSTYLKPQGGDQ